ncbi:branched-chain amino acid transporter AzlD [Mitsuokella sp. AF33-22]|uniref:branched-chain amino acid transporter permease n=1 Tax=Mitsuokella sp. AF33-22 TaxID=2292047 RepID=UPI000E5069B2|nr:branched-chain amino acid transporter permease [Mitsuokella sp. AF33-22]RHM57760.1 branched-chain amino acid transporter AzlD [Mitsuokella sp. AF33-22]
MTLTEQVITIAACAIGTMLTRYLPFLVFSSRKPTPDYIQYLGRALPCAIFAMLVVYCLKDVTITAGSHGLPEAIAIAVTILLHKALHQMLLSIAGGTICYMLLSQYLFTH